VEIIPLTEFITAAAAGDLQAIKTSLESEISIRILEQFAGRISCRRCISLQNRPRNVAVFVADRVYASYSANPTWSTGGMGPRLLASNDKVRDALRMAPATLERTTGDWGEMPLSATTDRRRRKARKEKELEKKRQKRVRQKEQKKASESGKQQKLMRPNASRQ
jgi:hypothetical protein